MRNYEAAAAGAQAAAEAVEAKKQELRDSRVNDTAYGYIVPDRVPFWYA